MDIPQKIDNPEDVNRKRTKCNRRVTLRTKAVECDGCLNRCHKECDGFWMRITEAYQKKFGSAN